MTDFYCELGAKCRMIDTVQCLACELYQDNKLPAHYPVPMIRMNCDIGADCVMFVIQRSRYTVELKTIPPCFLDGMYHGTI